MKLSVLIPCYNEVELVEQLLNAVRNSPYEPKEIIVVDDGSSDGTREILQQNSDKIDQLIFHSHNQGKGAALSTAIQAATGDILIIQDADLEYDPNEYLLMISPILENKADVVYGSRFLTSHPRRVVYFWHMVGNRFLTLLSNIFTNITLTDMETCYKAFRKEIIKNIQIQEKRFGVEPELTAKVSKLNCRIYEVGISYYGRTYKEGKKIGWKDGFSAIRCIIKYNVFYSAKK